MAETVTVKAANSSPDPPDFAEEPPVSIDVDDPVEPVETESVSVEPAEPTKPESDPAEPKDAEEGAAAPAAIVPFLRFDGAGAVHSSCLEIKASTIPEAGLGLFTTRDRGVGSWIGIYAGKFVHQRNASDSSGDYGADFPGGVGEEGVIVPRTRSGTNVINYARYPMAAMNEPKEGTQANAFLVEDVVYEHDDRGFRLLSLHTACPVKAGDEMFWHYGPAFRRAYAVGTPAEAPLVSPKVSVATLDALVSSRLGDGVFEISSRTGGRLGASQSDGEDSGDDSDDGDDGDDGDGLRGKKDSVRTCTNESSKKKRRLVHA